MTRFRSRPCEGVQDIPLMRQLLIELRQSYGNGYWHVGDLTWQTFLLTIRNSLQDTVRLWFDREHLVGFAVCDPPRRKNAEFDLQMHPLEGLADEMMNWVESCWAKIKEKYPDAPLVADPGFYESDSAILDGLARRGFDNMHNDGILLLRSLDAPVESRALPEGWTVRPIVGRAEAFRRAAVHRDAFHPSRVSDEQYLRLMGWPGYQDALDLVAVSPEGEFGSFCLGWLDPVNRIGEFEPVGTGSAFRRLGLASAVILEGLRRMRDAGLTHAVIGPIHESNTRALAVYQSLGFERTIKAYMFGKG